MLDIEIPGYKHLSLRHAIFDYNGTLAMSGKLLEGVKTHLNQLAEHNYLDIHIVTGDSFGTAKEALADICATLTILPAKEQANAKRDYVQKLGANHVVAIGNGRNDRYMLQDAALGIATLGADGTAIEVIQAADLMVRDVFEAIAMLQNPQLLAATLRE